jgi:hypothetical protein
LPVVVAAVVDTLAVAVLVDIELMQDLQLLPVLQLQLL